MSDLETLQSTWKTLYTTTLPSLARSKDPAQPHWPVVLDHCFARIILDNAIGASAPTQQPWTGVLKAPAWRHMSAAQLQAAIALAEGVCRGEADLVRLDEISLALRGKRSKVASASAGAWKGGATGAEKSTAGKRKRENGEGRISSYFSSENLGKRGTDADADADAEANTHSDTQADTHGQKVTRTRSRAGQEKLKHEHDNESSPRKVARLIDPITGTDQTFSDTIDPIALIDDAANEKRLTAFRKRVLKLLCQVPSGKYTTYAAISDAINASADKTDGTGKSGKTCARAIGSAMRNNPFAPLVPCHRVLATGGKIGGFGGEWGDEGKHALKKREMLRSEGVRFDGKGKVVGMPFTGFDVGKT